MLCKITLTVSIHTTMYPDVLIRTISVVLYVNYLPF